MAIFSPAQPLGAPGWVGENVGHFEHPENRRTPLGQTVTRVLVDAFADFCR
jgi:hypothetical protein